MNLVFIPFHDWKKCEREGFRTRDAHFMEKFESHPEVEKLLIINRPISVAEMAILRRNRHPQQGSVVFEQGDISISKVRANTYTLDILVREIVRPLRMKRSWTPYSFGRPETARAVETALAFLDIQTDYTLFMSAPLFAPLVKQLSPERVGFDAQDNLLKHALYRDVPDLASYYDYLLERADFISANSLETATWFRQVRPDAVHISNGVDKEVFSPDHAYDLPPDMAGIAGPVVGYAGKMQEMFDVELMSYVVRNLPEVNFVFIGQELNPGWMRPLWEYPNTHYLGDKQYVKLPRYLAAFDICVIPYNQTRQHGVDPIKFYEYVAAGKPVVTTKIGNVGAFEDFPQVRIADDSEGFLEAVRHFSTKIRENGKIPVTELPETYTWRAKADEIIQSIQLVEET